MSDQESDDKIDEISPNEIIALQNIIDSLKPLNADARRKLIQTVITFLEINLRSTSGTSYAPSISSKSIFTPGVLPKFSEDRSMSPKEFLLEKTPQNDVERVACLAYYLTHYLSTPHFKTLDISKLNTEAAQRKFANAATAVKNATNYGYLAPATKGQKQLSAAGELFVQALPDRDSAKAVMVNARPKRKSKLPSKKKVQD